MALNIAFTKQFNMLKDENIIIPRIVNKQTMEFSDFCEYLADGTTVTAGDVAAVMKSIEMRLPLILGMNSKVVVSPDGLTFRPKVSGSIGQSELHAKLQARAMNYPDLNIDVDREIETSDLTVRDLSVGIGIEIPKKWISRLESKATLKRVDSDEDDSQGSGDSGDSGNQGAQGDTMDNP